MKSCSIYRVVGNVRDLVQLVFLALEKHQVLKIQLYMMGQYHLLVLGKSHWLVNFCQQKNGCLRQDKMKQLSQKRATF